MLQRKVTKRAEASHRACFSLVKANFPSFNISLLLSLRKIAYNRKVQFAKRNFYWHLIHVVDIFRRNASATSMQKLFEWPDAEIFCHLGIFQEALAKSLSPVK